MRIDVLTLFPQMFDGFIGSSIVRRAIERHLVDIRLHNIRDYAHDKHRTVDDYPYGGGAGMVLKPEPIFEAVEAIKMEVGLACVPVVLLSPQGRLFTQEIARQLASYESMILICGRYEGVDERVAEHLTTDEISIGDYLLSGGEVAAMVVLDSVVRLLPGVLGSEASLSEDSYTEGLLEYPQYTRPAVYRGWAIPPVLLSGDHGAIARWRRQQRLMRTAKRRPDLFSKITLSDEDKKLLDEVFQTGS